MRHIQPDLWETETESPFPGLTTHAYLLVRDGGNVLFYNTSHVHELDRIAELGGLACQFLSHQDELGESLNTIAERFGSRLGGHIAEKAAFARYRTPDILFEHRERVLDGIEVIPVPGHSPGSTAFLVDSPTGKRYLFTGDTLYRAEGGIWKAGFIPGHSKPEDRIPLTESLRLLGTLNPDIVLSSAFGGDGSFQEMRGGEWLEHVNHAIELLHSEETAEKL